MLFWCYHFLDYKHSAFATDVANLGIFVQLLTKCNPINPYYTTPKTGWSNTLNRSKQTEKTVLPAPMYSHYIFVCSETILKIILSSIKKSIHKECCDKDSRNLCAIYPAVFQTKPFLMHNPYGTSSSNHNFRENENVAQMLFHRALNESSANWTALTVLEGHFYSVWYLINWK